MTNEQSGRDKKKANNQDAPIKPDPETLNTTDPEEHMEGPVSSITQAIEEAFEDESDEDQPKKEKE